MTQHERILEYMNRYGSISPMEAFSYLGVTKLATNISELIRDGMDIRKEWETGTNRFGDKVRYMRYRRGEQ